MKKRSPNKKTLTQGNKKRISVRIYPGDARFIKKEFESVQKFLDLMIFAARGVK